MDGRFEGEHYGVRKVIRPKVKGIFEIEIRQVYGKGAVRDRRLTAFLSML
jgi:hypothetical protein